MATSRGCLQPDFYLPFLFSLRAKHLGSIASLAARYGGRDRANGRVSVHGDVHGRASGRGGVRGGVRGAGGGLHFASPRRRRCFPVARR